MSDSEDEGRPPPVFKPRKSLMRTPPQRRPQEEELMENLESSPEDLATAAAQSVYESMMRRLSPKASPPGPPSTPAAKQAGKRILTPEEEIMRKVRRKLPRSVELGFQEVLPLPPDTPQEYRTPCSTDDDRAEFREAGEEVCDLSSASSRVLVRVANSAAEKVNKIMRGSSSRLNKADSAAISEELSRIMEVVAHLAISLGESSKNVDVSQSKLSAMSQALEAEKKRAQLAVEEKELARELAAAGASTTAPQGRGRSYADMAKAGPTVAVYPASESSDIKTADDTKRILKTSIAPANLNIRVEKVRRIAGAGVLIQTRSSEDMDKFKAAIPASLKTKDPKGRQPLVAFRNVEGTQHNFEEFMSQVHEQNFKDNSDWTLKKMKDSARLAFKKSRTGGDRTTLVVACEPALRKLLVSKGRLYIGWDVIYVEDFTTAICCRRCQMYGHQEAGCKAEAYTCGKCGGTGHKSEECKSDESRCATCHKFGHKAGALTHRTAAKECPARVHAEKRMAEITNY